jgi:pseudaminic acid biosynthesis-associated methylase
MPQTTEQEEFWKGSFGAEYTERNVGLDYETSIVAFFRNALRRAYDIRSIFEIGTNRGLNLDALSTIVPHAKLAGIEINESAAKIVRERHSGVILGSINSAAIDAAAKYDLVFTKGVLIHIAPSELTNIYRRMRELSARYVLIAEYYNPTPVAIEYRGHKNKLFKRDFAGEFIDETGFRLIDYGFAYRRDPVSPDDDINWFLMERP